MATAQFDAWNGVHKGSIDAVARTVDASLADAALARMMLYRRRAVAARVVNDFFARVGGRFLPYLAGRITHPPADYAAESATAKAAGDIVDNVYGAPPPLLFERALLAEAGGRLEDAGADLERLLSSYPGFVAAAIAAARVASAAGDPGRAIRSLAVVEGEVTHIREGAVLLSDAARALGLHEAASRYDLAALVSRGAYDSRGNDCAPVDVTGKIANDDRLPQIFYFEMQADGSVVCNLRGVYYQVNPLLRWALSLYGRKRPVSVFRNLGGRGTRSTADMRSQVFGAMTARLSLFLRPSTSSVRILRRLVTLWARMLRNLREIGAALFRWLAGLSAAVIIVSYRVYQLLPLSVQARIKGRVAALLARMRPLARSQAQRWVPYARRGLVAISEQDAALRLARMRYRSGIARIFGLAPPAGEAASSAGGMRQQPHSLYAGDAPSSLGELHMLAPGKLPPLAAEVLSRLASEVDDRGESPPQS